MTTMRVRSTTESAVRAASSDNSRSVRLNFYSSSPGTLGCEGTPRLLEHLTRAVGEHRVCECARASGNGGSGVPPH